MLHIKKISITLIAGIMIVQSLSAQNVGIGTTSPKARLHVADSSVVFTAEGFTLPQTPGAPPVSGAGRRMMWYPDKAAFRAGAVGGTQWDIQLIGNYSFSGGMGGYVSGFASTGFGWLPSATGDYSFAAGNDVKAAAKYSTAFGYLSSVYGDYGFAAGSSTATGDHSTALGSSEASGRGAFSSGALTIASGSYSFAANRNTYAGSAYETVFGRYNTMYNPASQTDWVATDRLFVIGNGTSANARSNAVTVFKNGNVGIMTAQPNARLSVSGDASKTGGGVWAAWSDARLKKNITPYTIGLKEILQINPVRFQYNELSGEEDLNKNFVGIIAQEIEKVLPSTITIKQDSVLKDKRMFDGSELTYTLINAVKELKQEVDSLKKKIVALENSSKK